MKKVHRIAIIALNNIIHDARVIKEAKSLTRAGYDVTILGLKLNKQDERIFVEFKTKFLNWFDHLSYLKTILVIVIIFNSIIFLFGFVMSYQVVLLVSAILGIFIFLSLGAFVVLNLWFPRQWYGLRRKFLPIYLEFLFGLFVFRELKIIKPTIVHCHDFNTLWFGVKYKKYSKCHLVYDAHEIYEETASVKKRDAYAIKERTNVYSKYIDIFITVNEFIATYYQQTYKNLVQAKIVYNSAEKDSYNQGLEHKNRIRKKLNLSEQKKILLFQGAFSKSRGLEEVVSAAKYYPHDWCLVLMGWGELEVQLRELAKVEETLGKSVFFLPRVEQSELSNWTKDATCGLIPYLDTCLNHRYCSPNKLWEYPRSGIPIISSNLPFLRKIIVENDMGWLIDDLRYLPDILKLITDQSLMHKKLRAEEYFATNNWTQSERVLIESYSELN